MGGLGRWQARGWGTAQPTLGRRGEGRRVRRPVCWKGTEPEDLPAMTFVEQAHWCSLRMSARSFWRGFVQLVGEGDTKFPSAPAPQAPQESGGGGAWKRKVLLYAPQVTTGKGDSGW